MAAIGSRQVHTSTNGGKKIVSVDWDSDNLVAIALSGEHRLHLHRRKYWDCPAHLVALAILNSYCLTAATVSHSLPFCV